MCNRGRHAAGVDRAAGGWVERNPCRAVGLLPIAMGVQCTGLDRAGAKPDPRLSPRAARHRNGDSAAVSSDCVSLPATRQDTCHNSTIGVSGWSSRPLDRARDGPGADGTLPHRGPTASREGKKPGRAPDTRRNAKRQSRRTGIAELKRNSGEEPERTKKRDGAGENRDGKR